jgi:DNA-binding NarL/FixJ family response regulator
MIRVAIADDHAIVRAGLASVLAAEPDMQLVGEASDGHGAIALVQRTSVDVLLVDLSMPLLHGVDAIARVRAVAPRTRVLVLSMHKTPEYVRPALRAGAHGYVVKGPGLDELVRAVRAVHAGETYLDAAATEVVEAGDGPGRRGEPPLDDLDRLTPREREVLRMIAEGHTNRSIGLALGVSPKTVDAHRSNLMRKLGIHDVQGLTRLAMRRGLVSE